MGSAYALVAPSIRLILAMFRLYADIQANFGRAIVDILKKQYPDQNVTADPSSVGHKMWAIALKQNQRDEQRATDTIQEFLSYLTTGTKFVNEVDPDTGETTRVPRGKEHGAKAWDFRKDFNKWEDALEAIYSNLRTKSISKSIDTMRRKKKEKSVDEAFGTRPEGGGAEEGGEARLPTSDESTLGMALDNKAALKEFYDLIDSYIPDLKASLSRDTGAVFDMVFEHNVGGFGSDIKENMNQSSFLREKYPDVWADFVAKWSPEIRRKNPDLDEKKIDGKIKLKWAAYLGDLRKDLLEEIWDFINENMSPNDFQVLRDEFFSDTTPEQVQKREDDKSRKQVEYQRGRDYRTILKARKEKKDGDQRIKNLVKKLESDLQAEGKNLEEELKKEEGKGSKESDEDKSEGQTQTSSVVLLISSQAFRAWS